MLNCPTGPASLRENFGFPERTIRTIVTELGGHISELCDEWSSIHGYA